MRQQDSLLPSGPCQNSRVVGPGQTDVLNADKIEVGEAAAKAADDVGVEVLVRGQSEHRVERLPSPREQASATEPIDDTSTGKLMEGVLAAFAQFDNDVRSDRTRAGMKAALELGRWVFLAPLGYMNAPRMLGKSLMPDPERAPLVRRAFEEYATGQFTKQQLLQQVTTWGLRNRRGQPLSSQSIGMLLRNQLYAGIVDVAEYGVRGRRGDFEPLVSEDTFYRVQAVLSGRTPSLAPQLGARIARSTHRKCRCEKAQPDPDFRYFSNATARDSSPNCTTTSITHGLYRAVCGTRPALWASSRRATSDVRPV